MNRLPEAIFDTLYIGDQIQTKIDDFNIIEVQSLAYLACLISLYDKNPTAFWKYQFIKNELSSPYSLEIHTTISFLDQVGYLEETTENYYKVSSIGMENLSFYIELNSFQQRTKYLSIACRSVNIIPLNLIKNAIKKDPILTSADHSAGKRFLLDPNSIAVSALYEDFFNLRIALEGEFTSLFAPAIVWLQSLINDKDL